MVYLAGQNDFDSEIAKEKGFNINNLIAVDYNRKTTQRLRSSKRLTVCGDIMDVVEAWPITKKINVLILDFCCGLFTSIVEFLLKIPHFPQLSDSVIVINLLRGRDAQTNTIRQNLGGQRFKGLEKHRGRQALLIYVVELTEIIHKQKYGVSTRGHHGSQMVIQTGQECIIRTLPRLHSYKSDSGQWFDSAVFVNPILISDPVRQPHSKDIAQQISAILAIRTMRLKETKS